MSKIVVIAEHPDQGRKAFSLPVWETIREWPNQGGWVQVRERPAEAEPAKRKHKTTEQHDSHRE